jgi:hypothetical protein
MSAYSADARRQYPRQSTRGWPSWSDIIVNPSAFLCPAYRFAPFTRARNNAVFHRESFHHVPCRRRRSASEETRCSGQLTAPFDWVSHDLA